MNLGALGSIAGGISQGASPYIQQYLYQQQQAQDDAAAGLGLYAMMGVTPPQAAPPQQGGLGGLLSGLGGGARSSAPPPQATAPAPAPPSIQGQGGIARMPIQPPSAPTPAQPQQIPSSPASPGFSPSQTAQIAPSATALAPRSVPTPAPPAQAGVSSQPAQITRPPQVSPGAVPTTATANPLAQKVAQGPTGQPSTPPVQTASQPSAPPQGQGADPFRQYSGMFDFNTLMSNLVRTPGMTPQKLGRIARSPAFERMLTQEGLNQYHALRLGIEGFNAQTGRGRLDEKTDEDRRRDARVADNERYREESTRWTAKYKTGQENINAINKAIDSQIITIRAEVTAGQVDPKEGDARIKALNDERDTKIKEIQGKVGDPPEAPGEEKAVPEAAPVQQGQGTPENPVTVKTPQDANALKPGTVYKTPDGQLMVR